MMQQENSARRKLPIRVSTFSATLIYTIHVIALFLLLAIAVEFNSAVLIISIFVVATIIAVVAQKSALALSIAIVAGFSQELLATYTESSELLWIDDTTLAIAITPSVYRFYRGAVTARPSRLGWTLAILLVFALAIVRSSNEAVAVLQSRQLIWPILLAIVGFELKFAEIQQLCKTLLGLGGITAAFTIYEFIVGRPPIDPVPSALLHGFRTTQFYHGLPGNYFYYADSGAASLRAGGPLLNPTTTGLFLACAIVALAILKSTLGPALSIGTGAILAASLLATQSRGGILIAGCAVLLPLARHILGKRFGIVVVAAPLLLSGIALGSEEGSSNHVEGLSAGFQKALDNPLGAGFGVLGNYANSEGTTARDSLAGVLLSAFGVAGIIMLVLIALAVLRHYWSSPPRSTRSGIIIGTSLGLFLAILFSETATALNATILLWILFGFTFCRPLVDRQDGRSVSPNGSGVSCKGATAKVQLPD